MKIGLDASWAIFEKAGIGQYNFNLIRALLESDKKNDYVLFFNFYSRRRERLKQIQKLIGGAQAPAEVRINNLPIFLKERLTLWPLSFERFYRQRVDVFHSPFFTGIGKKSHPQTVTTIHDLTFIKFPEHRGRKLSQYYLYRTKLALENSQKIIAVSYATKKDLVGLLDVNPAKIEVVYEGVSPCFTKIASAGKISRIKKKYLPVGQKYILSVCTLEPRKNLARLLGAYALLPHALSRDYKLVLVGQKGWNNREFFQTVDNLNLKESIILPGFVPAEDLPYLYNGAAVFVYPSLYEGFGLPLLEAMACGVPAVTSNTSSLPEVAGKAGLLVNPYKEEEIAVALRRILINPNFSQKLSQKGLIQAKKFSWEKAARETLKVYEKVYKESLL